MPVDYGRTIDLGEPPTDSAMEIDEDHHLHQPKCAHRLMER